MCGGAVAGGTHLHGLVERPARPPAELGREAAATGTAAAAIRCTWRNDSRRVAGVAQIDYAGGNEPRAVEVQHLQLVEIGLQAEAEQPTVFAGEQLSERGERARTQHSGALEIEQPHSERAAATRLACRELQQRRLVRVRRRVRPPLRIDCDGRCNTGGEQPRHEIDKTG
jgi:hypothetical protein